MLTPAPEAGGMQDGRGDTDAAAAAYADAHDDDDVMGQLTQTECLRRAWHRPQGLHRQSLI